MPQLIPEPGPRRVLAASNSAYTVGSGLHLTAGVLYFTKPSTCPRPRSGQGLSFGSGRP